MRIAEWAGRYAAGCARARQRLTCCPLGSGESCQAFHSGLLGAKRAPDEAVGPMASLVSRRFVLMSLGAA